MGKQTSGLVKFSGLALINWFFPEVLGIFLRVCRFYSEASIGLTLISLRGSQMKK